MEWRNRFGVIGHWGYRTLRVAGGVTFWLSGAGKSVLEVVGVNLKDGQNVLVLWRLFGVLVWGSWCWRWLCRREPVYGPLFRHRGLGQVVCGDGIDRAMPLARRWLRYRRCYEW